MNNREMVSWEMEKNSISGDRPENESGTGKPKKRKGVLLWITAGVALSFWMFFLGILVGRGTAPVHFDTQSLQKELLALKKAAIEKTLRQHEKDSKSADEKKGVVFYEVLKRSSDGPDPQWAPRPPRPQQQPQQQQQASQQLQRLLEVPHLSTSPGTTVAAAPSGSTEHPGAPGGSKLPAAPSVQPGAGVQKPITATKEPNAVPPMKVRLDNFKKPATLKNTQTVKPPEKSIALAAPPPAPPSSPPASLPVPAPAAVAPSPQLLSATGSWTIQVAASKDMAEADRIVAKLKQQGYPASKLTGEVVGKGVWHRVRIGPYQRREEADAVVGKLSKEGLSPIAINSGSVKE